MLFQLLFERKLMYLSVWLGRDCGGVAENTVDTLHILSTHASLVLLFVGYSLNLTMFNFLSNTVSNVLSAVHRQLINAARTISVSSFPFMHFRV